MKIKNKILLFIIIIFMPMSIFAGAFKDVNESGNYSWAYTYVEKMAKENILRGFPDGTYKPNKPVSFLESLQILKSISVRAGENQIDSLNSYKNIFKEYKIPEWSREAVSFSLTRGVVSELTLKAAYKKNMINSKSYPSRNTVALLFARFLSVKEDGDYSSLTYKDLDSIPDNIKKILPKLIEMGIFSKDGSNGNFNGSKFIRRSEMAVISSKLLDYIKANPNYSNDNMEIDINQIDNKDNIIDPKANEEELKKDEKIIEDVINSKVNFKGKISNIVDGGTIKYMYIDITESDNKNLILPKTVIVYTNKDLKVGDLVEGRAVLDENKEVKDAKLNDWYGK